MKSINTLVVIFKEGSKLKSIYNFPGDSELTLKKCIDFVELSARIAGYSADLYNAVLYDGDIINMYLVASYEPQEPVKD